MSTTATLFGEAVAKAVMDAAAVIVCEKAVDIDVDALVVALRREGVAAANAILADGRDLVNAGCVPWLSSLFRSECTAAAQRAVDSVR